MHHRDGGPDPTELPLTVQQVFHRPTGACHTSLKYPSQPVMGGVLGLLIGHKASIDPSDSVMSLRKHETVRSPGVMPWHLSSGLRLLGVGLFVVLLSGCGGPESGSEPGPLPFGDEVQQVLVDGLAESSGAGVSAAVIVPGYEPWVGAAGFSAIGSDGLVPMRSAPGP